MIIVGGVKVNAARTVVSLVMVAALAGCSPGAPPSTAEAKGARVSAVGGGLALGDVPLTLDVDPELLCAAYTAADLPSLVSVEVEDPESGVGAGTLESGAPRGYCQAVHKADQGPALVGVGVFPAGALDQLRDGSICTEVTTYTLDQLPGVVCTVEGDGVFQQIVGVQVNDETSLGLQTMELAGSPTATTGPAKEALAELVAYLGQELAG